MAEKFSNYKVCGWTPDWADIPLWMPLFKWWREPTKVLRFTRDILRDRKQWNDTIDRRQNAYPHRRYPFLLKI